MRSSLPLLSVSSLAGMADRIHHCASPHQQQPAGPQVIHLSILPTALIVILLPFLALVFLLLTLALRLFLTLTLVFLLLTLTLRLLLTLALVVLLLFLTAVLFLLPFLSSTILAGKKENWVPPKSAKTEEVPGGQMLTLPGQSEAVGVLWYDSVGTERHHKLEICLKYRGIELTRSKDVADVFSDDKHWMKEYFLQNGKLLQSHKDYVISTLGPGSSAGVHLILMTNQSSMSAREFSVEAAKISNRLYEMIREEHSLPGDASKATAAQ